MAICGSSAPSALFHPLPVDQKQQAVYSEDMVIYFATLATETNDYKVFTVVSTESNGKAVGHIIYTFAFNAYNADDVKIGSAASLTEAVALYSAHPTFNVPTVDVNAPGVYIAARI
jgi:hypothetical protein